MNDIKYPILADQNTDERHTLSGLKKIAIGRSPTATIPILDLHCSREQCVITEQDGKYFITNLSDAVVTLVNDISFEDTEELAHGDTIRFGTSEFRFIAHDGELVKSDTIASMTAIAAQQTIVPTLPQRSANEATVMATEMDQGEVVEFEGSVPVTDDIILGRDNNKCDLLLEHPQVSRVHAQVSHRRKRTTIVDLNSANGTYVNGRRIASTQILKSGDLIDIGPFSLSFEDDHLVPRSRAEHVEVSCSGLTRHVVDAVDNRNRITILDDVSLKIPPCEFICILGPSGSGKSTLLNALSGRIPADEGGVTINGKDLYHNFQALKRDIAVVPQKDILHDALTVEDALSYTAKLRLPPDTSDFEIESAVLSMIDMVGLRDRSNTRIRNLSGGQLKRASLANETISQPGLLFLDEVTSGLDEQTDFEMMYLFRNIAENGKTVICITHSLAHVEETCHRVVILAEGGVLAFIGSPQDALSYFGISKLGQIYEKLNTKPSQQWRRDFQLKNDLDTVVGDDKVEESGTDLEVVERPPFSCYCRQTTVLLKRYFNIQKSDSANLLLMLGQCCLVSLLIVILFGNIAEQDLVDRAGSSTKILFLLAISTFWFGCNNAAKEIIKERIIFIREKDVNLLPESYYLSKYILLAIVSLLQTCILFYFVRFGTSVEISTAHLVILGLLSLSGVAMGLLISSAATTTDIAVTAVPLILIPQIIFSGAISDVSGLAEFLASISIVVYWAYGGLVSSLPEELIEHTIFVDWSAGNASVVLVFHMMVYIGVAVVLLRMIKSTEAIYQRIIRTISQQAKKVRSIHRSRLGAPEDSQ